MEATIKAVATATTNEIGFLSLEFSVMRTKNNMETRTNTSETMLNMMLKISI